MDSNQGKNVSDASQARQTFNLLLEISNILGTGLDSEMLVTCVRLCEAGVDPRLLANLIVQLKNTAVSYKDQKK